MEKFVYDGAKIRLPNLGFWALTCTYIQIIPKSLKK